MASSRPASRYASFESRSSASSSSSSASPAAAGPRNPSKNLSALKRLIANSGARHPPQPEPTSSGHSSRALIAPSGKGKSGQNFGSMVRKLMEKRPNPKPGAADRMALVVPADLIAEDLKKNAKGSNLSALHRKLFQKGGSADRTAGKALTEVKTNTRTLAMVLRSERELLNQNKEYEAEILQLRLLVEEKNREVDKLKELCLDQREEIKALKDAILFPDVMNTQLQELLQKQGSELKQAKQVIPSLQRQVSSLTGKIQCLEEDLGKVKADKYAARTYLDSDEHGSSPRTPIFDQETANALEYSSGEAITSEYGSPDELFLKDFNPCLTPRFSKATSREYNELSDYGSPYKDTSFQNIRQLSPNIFSNSRGIMMSKSTEQCQRPSLGSCSVRKICKSGENKWLEKLACQNLF